MSDRFISTLPQNRNRLMTSYITSCPGTQSGAGYQPTLL